MENDKSIDVLNNLITINNDRIQGYETAIDETEDLELKTQFAAFIRTSQQCKSELEAVVTQLGGKPAEGTRPDGKIYRVWMDFKALVTGKDRKGILNSCEYGEDVAVNTYKKVLENNTDDLTEGQLAMVEGQHDLIKADHDMVKSLRDSLVEAN